MCPEKDLEHAKAEARAGGGQYKILNRDYESSCMQVLRVRISYNTYLLPIREEYQTKMAQKIYSVLEVQKSIQDRPKKLEVCIGQPASQPVVLAMR